MLELVALIVCTVLAFSQQTSAAATPENNNSMIVGDRVKGDLLLATKHVHENWKLLTIATKNLTYTSNGFTKISQIEILDQDAKGTSASPKIIAGGPGDSYVTVMFESRYMHGIGFVVNIYGVKSRVD